MAPTRVLSAKAARAEAHGLIAWAIGQAEHKGPDAIREDLRKRLGDAAIPEQRSAGDDDDNGNDGRALQFQTFDELAAEVDNAPPRRWLIRNVWPHGDYGVMAATPKAQKTWCALDLAVSVATGKPWLGYKPVDVTGSVIVFLGEGGKANAVRRIRAIAEHRKVKDAGLQIVVCARAPHLTVRQHLAELEEKVSAVKPVLVLIDPLYLAARGADLRDLYAMGAVLENVQVVCQRHGASLMLVHHFNRNAAVSGAARNAGAGPQEWARVLLSIDVASRKAGSLPGETVVVTKLDVQGGEVPDQYFSITRRVWSDDPDDITSPMHIGITVSEDESETVETDQGEVKLSPAAVKLLEALETIGAPASVLEMGDAIAARHGNGLRRETISKTLNLLRERGLVDHQEHEAGQREGKLWFLTEQGKKWQNRRSEPVTTCDQAKSSDDLDGKGEGEGQSRRSEPVIDVTSHVTDAPDQATCDRVTDVYKSRSHQSQVITGDGHAPAEDPHKRRVIGVSEINSRARPPQPAVAGPVPPGPLCARCQQPSDRPLILGRCRRCAYPAGDGPDQTAEPATEMARLTFTTWLAGHRDADGPLGDLARDVAADKAFPADLDSWPALEAHMRREGAIQEALDAAYDAFCTYRRETTA